MVCGFLTSSGAADFGWTGYAPLSEVTRTRGSAATCGSWRVVLTGLSGMLTAVNIVATV